MTLTLGSCCASVQVCRGRAAPLLLAVHSHALRACRRGRKGRASSLVEGRTAVQERQDEREGAHGVGCSQWRAGRVSVRARGEVACSCGACHPVSNAPSSPCHGGGVFGAFAAVAAVLGVRSRGAMKPWCSCLCADCTIESWPCVRTTARSLPNWACRRPLLRAPVVSFSACALFRFS